MAPPAAEVARWAARAIGTRTVISDAPEWDGYWLRRLLETADGLDVPIVRDFDAAVARRFDPDGVRRVHAALEELPAPHRAGPDASRLAAAWLAGMGE